MLICHNCGTQLTESTKFCPSCGAANQGTHTQSQQFSHTAISSNTPIQTDLSSNKKPENPIQQNVVVLGNAKSVGVAFFLALLFGPLGLLYASILGGVTMFFVALILFFILPVIGAVISWIACIIWACVAANNANKKLVTRGNALITNQIQR